MHLEGTTSKCFVQCLAGEDGLRFKSAILDTEAHTQRLYQVLLTNPELAKMIESEVMRSSYQAMREAEPGDEAG